MRITRLVSACICVLSSMRCLHTAALSQYTIENPRFPPPTEAFTTRSGLPVCRYAIGGAARSTQPASLPSAYYSYLCSSSGDDSSEQFPLGSPFLFYYNPHKYPAFMSGIQELCRDANRRQNIFVSSGGAERSAAAMEQRLKDALKACGGGYLDLFLLEYVCPGETNGDSGPGQSLKDAIEQAQGWKEQGLIRYISASTHSHRVGAILAKETEIDAVMLRYGMSHKDAAESISFPACVQEEKPVIAFTTTRWNALQDGHSDWKEHDPPTTGDCLSFALVTEPVEIVLHSPRDEQELVCALEGLSADMSHEETTKWRSFGNLEWNNIDAFDEYPQERSIH